ncbi:unnamed protein product [Calypogeia fissa]
MLGALKFMPREEVDRHDGENESSRGRSKKRKYKDKVKAKTKSKSRERRKRARFIDSEGTGNRSGSGSSDDSDRELEASALELKEDAKTRRKEAGLGWMLNAPDRPLGSSAPSKADQENPTLDSEKPKSHARELNPYLAAGAEEDGQPAATQKAAVSKVGDGGASWRLKALKRAQERAAREGGSLEEIVEDRWGSLANLTSSVAVRRSAHANAHLHAIRDRKTRKNEGSAEDGATDEKEPERGSKDGPRADRRDDDNRRYNSQMRVPRPDTSLSWKSRKKFENQPLRDEDAAIVRAAATRLNKYAGDGSFLRSFETEREAERSRSSMVDKPSMENPGEQASTSDSLDVVYEPTRVFKKLEEDLENRRGSEEETVQAKPVALPPDGGSSSGLSANQVAAKAMRLRLVGKTKEADELLKDFEARAKDGPPQRPSTQDSAAPPVQQGRPRQVSSSGLNMSSFQAKEKLHARNQSSDAEMAGTIARNKLFKGNVDDEYEDFGNGMETELVHEQKGSKKKLAEKSTKQTGREGFRHLTIQQEQCQFCFENPRRPKHLVIAIANFVYLMLPPSPSLVPFHCYIVPMQHDGGTRNVDENVWQEVRNFKKCLVQMFGDQGKGVLFLETSMKVSRQRRHCLIECIPVPSDVEKDAPLYFKKAIDEAEDEWSQHNAKKLIDTRQKGLRNSIPKNFPYFHVEFGMQGGYCHVIDDETSFKPQFGRDVVAGMLELEEEGHRRQDSMEQQRSRVKQFLKLWEPFDWTKMLD